MENYVIEYLITANGKSPVIDWLNSLDTNLRKRITQRILRLQDGNFGDSKQISKDIFELRFMIGKGYRIYYTKKETRIIILINGGDKSTQSKDIKTAEKLLAEWSNDYE